MPSQKIEASPQSKRPLASLCTPIASAQSALRPPARNLERRRARSEAPPAADPGRAPRATAGDQAAKKIPAKR
jgi:hypothetical protein